jgi:hypothetical protein
MGPVHSHGRCRFATSPFGGEVDPLGSGEGAFLPHHIKKRPPHPALRADLSPEGRGEK